VPDDHDTSILLGDTIIVADPAMQPPLQQQHQQPLIKRGSEEIQEEELPEDQGEGHDQTSPGPGPEESVQDNQQQPAVDEAVQTVHKRGQKDWGPASRQSARQQGREPHSDMSALMAQQSPQLREPSDIEEALRGPDRDK
jgi:hypothetical protein